MKRKNIILWFIFFTLLIGCSSSPKLFVPKHSTINMPDIGQVQMQEMLIGEHRGVDNNVLLYKMAVPGLDDVFVYSVVASAVGKEILKYKRQQLVDERKKGLKLIPLPAAAEGPFRFIIDGETYSLDDIQEDTVDTYVVYSKSAVLKMDIREAILKCSQLEIQISVKRTDSGAVSISPDGLTAVKKFLAITPAETVLNALQSLEEEYGY